MVTSTERFESKGSLAWNSAHTPVGREMSAKRGNGCKIVPLADILAKNISVSGETL